MYATLFACISMSDLEKPRSGFSSLRHRPGFQLSVPLVSVPFAIIWLWLFFQNKVDRSAKLQTLVMYPSCRTISTRTRCSNVYRLNKYTSTNTSHSSTYLIHYIIYPIHPTNYIRQQKVNFSRNVHVMMQY